MTDRGDEWRRNFRARLQDFLLHPESDDNVRQPEIDDYVAMQTPMCARGDHDWRDMRFWRPGPPGGIPGLAAYCRVCNRANQRFNRHLGPNGEEPPTWVIFVCQNWVSCRISWRCEGCKHIPEALIPAVLPTAPSFGQETDEERDARLARLRGSPSPRREMEML